MNDQLPFIIGQFIGAFIFVLILARIARKLLKGNLPKLVGLPRVLVYLAPPIILILILNTGSLIYYLISALIHSFFLYDEEKNKKTS